MNDYDESLELAFVKIVSETYMSSSSMPSITDPTVVPDLLSLFYDATDINPEKALNKKQICQFRDFLLDYIAEIPASAMVVPKIVYHLLHLIAGQRLYINSYDVSIHFRPDYCAEAIIEGLNKPQTDKLIKTAHFTWNNV